MTDTLHPIMADIISAHGFSTTSRRPAKPAVDPKIWAQTAYADLICQTPGTSQDDATNDIIRFQLAATAIRDCAEKVVAELRKTEAAYGWPERNAPALSRLMAEVVASEAGLSGEAETLLLAEVQS